MYKTRKKEFDRNVFRFVILLLIGFAIAMFLYWAISLGFNMAKRESIFSLHAPLWIVIAIEAILCLLYKKAILSSIIRVVPANTVLLRHNPVNSKILKKSDGDSGGQTNPDEYRSGIHLVYPGGEDVKFMSLKSHTSKVYKHILSSIVNDEPILNYSFIWERDPRRCAWSVRYEDDKIDDILKTLIDGEIEAFFGEYVPEGRKRPGITINRLFQILTELKNALSEHLTTEVLDTPVACEHVTSETEDRNTKLKAGKIRLLNTCLLLGIRIKQVNIGDIDRSEDNAKSIRVGAAVLNHGKAASMLIREIEKAGREIDAQSAIGTVMMVSDEAEGKVIILGTAEGDEKSLKDSALLGEMVNDGKKKGGK